MAFILASHCRLLMNQFFFELVVISHALSLLSSRRYHFYSSESEEDSYEEYLMWKKSRSKLARRYPAAAEGAILAEPQVLEEEEQVASEEISSVEDDDESPFAAYKEELAAQADDVETPEVPSAKIPEVEVARVVPEVAEEPAKVVVEEPVEEPAAVEEPVEEPAAVEEPVAEPKTEVSGPIKSPGIGPHIVSLSDGDKYICRCGQSESFPFCDGTHVAVNEAQGTNYSPFKASQEELGQDTVYVCGCGESKKRQTGQPFCDGSHANLTEEQKAARTVTKEDSTQEAPVASEEAPETAAKESLVGPLLKPGVGPIPVSLADGEKYICRCGQSDSYPFCDGTHVTYNEAQGTNYSPFKASQEELGQDTVYVCGCGESKKREEEGVPFCDGSHTNLTDEQKAARAPASEAEKSGEASPMKEDSTTEEDSAETTPTQETPAVVEKEASSEDKRETAKSPTPDGAYKGAISAAKEVELATQYQFDGKAWLAAFRQAKRDKDAGKISALRRIVQRGTNAVLTDGQYEKDKKQVALAALENPVRETTFYDGKSPFGSFDRPHQTTAHFVKADCVDVALFLMDKKSVNPVVLVMADEETPGGSSDKGTCAQEESIYRRTTLKLSLEDPQNFDKNRDWKYNIPTFGGVYCPDVQVFRSSENRGYQFLPSPKTLSFICASAIKNPALAPKKKKVGLYMNDEDAKITRKKIETILSIGLQKGHDAIVLSAFGCGYNKNSPNHMAKLFREVITQVFASCYKHVTFAIIDDENAGLEHNPDGNIKPFQEEFLNVSSREASRKCVLF